jgi:hypothetical protein
MFFMVGHKKENPVLEKLVPNPNIAVEVYTGTNEQEQRISLAAVGFRPIAILIANATG